MDDNRVRIKFYSSDDLSLGYNMDKALLLLANYDGNAVCTDVNDAIEFFNIYQCSATGLKPRDWADDEHTPCCDTSKRMEFR